MSLLSSTKMIYLLIVFSLYETKFIEIKALDSGDYLVICDNGIFIYDFTLKNKEKLKIFNQKIDDLDDVIIKKHSYKENIFIFCLIKNYLYICANSNRTLFECDINANFEDFGSYNYNYNDIIPYNSQINILNLFISSIKESKYRYCSKDCKYNQYINFNINFSNNKLSLINQKINKFTINNESYKEKNKCHLLDSSFTIKCILYDKISFINIKYNITSNIVEIDKYWVSYNYFNFNEIASSKSDKNNYLVCTLYKEKQCYYDYYCYYFGNFTECELCDNDNNYDKCPYISYLYEKECSIIKSFYFHETDKYVLICKKFKEFILSTIDYDKKEVISKNRIYINCTDRNEYNGKFSLLFNNSINDYHLITDYDFIDNPKCFFYKEIIANESYFFNITERNKTYMEENNQKIILENNYSYINDSFEEDLSYYADMNDSSEYINNNAFMSDKIENIEESIKEIKNLVDSTEIINNSNYEKKTMINSSYILTENIEEKTNNNEEIIIIVEKETTNKTKEELINNINDLMKDKEIGKNYEIKGEDFTLIIKPTNTPPLPNTTHVEFDECEQIIRKVYNISNTSIITFFQMELNNEDNSALYNQIKYTIYDDELKEIDLSICKDIETQIHYAIKDDADLDLKAVSNYKDLGVDVLDINDDFFTNLCHAFSDSNKDMILEDRIKYIFQNYSLCEEGCTYNNIDITTRSISCDCKIQGNNISTVTASLVFNSGKDSSVFDSNIGVSKCYNLVFSFHNKMQNVGFIVFSVLVLSYIIFIIIHLKKGIKPVTDYLHREMIIHGYLNEDAPNFFENINSKMKKIDNSTVLGIKNIKEKKEEDKNIDSDKNKKILKKKKKKGKKKKKLTRSINLKESNTIIEEQEKQIEMEKNKSIDKYKIFNEKKKKNTKEKSIKNEEDNEDNNFGIIKLNLNSDIKKYYPKDSNQSLHNYTFEEAIKYDRRNIFRILYIYLLSKQIIFRTFLQRSPIELLHLRFTLFIFMLSCDLALNALFYFNDNISKKYHYAKNLFLFTFSNNITIIIYSTLLSSFLLTLLSKLSNSSNAIRKVFRKEEEKIKLDKKYRTSEETKRQIFSDVENILKIYKLKIFILLIIETVLILFFWYFVTAFCHVYTSTQTSWLLDSFLSILSRLMLELIFAFLYAKLYQVAVGSNIETFYKILLFIYDFS